MKLNPGLCSCRATGMLGASSAHVRMHRSLSVAEYGVTAAQASRHGKALRLHYGRWQHRPSRSRPWANRDTSAHAFTNL